MKRGFTLVEMLIVVALIATMMSIVLRLTSVGADENYRNETIVRLAKLENCLSGYYAAYGSYPPVPLHNRRDIFEGVNSYGVQNMDEKESGDKALLESELWSWDVKKFQSDIKNATKARTRNDPSSQESERKAWRQVKAACEAQPLALEAPDPEIRDLSGSFKELREAVEKQKSVTSDNPDSDKWRNGFGTVDENPGSFDEKATDWRDIQLFKFGVMSFLLPRFQSMMGWPDSLISGDRCRYEQWNANCGAEPHNPFSGGPQTWKEINKTVRDAMGYGGSTSTDTAESRAQLEAFPTEATTARWMPNLEKICACDYPDRIFFGMKINDPNYKGGLYGALDGATTLPLSVYKSGGNRYHLNRISVLDGWGTDFFYYSPSPHQSYQLWSAGKNRRTFPPWIPKKSFSADAQKHIAAWIEDDIRGMNN